ncbi:glutamate receptor ionotropic, kainate 2-like [Vanessa tameamea]|uniref:Glutamate receptor ionotropic, kainate 2-like n=1 Tax=Vanessa tameamea TaxID=334116 RepID=A0A8B8HYA6_VANTA
MASLKLFLLLIVSYSLETNGAHNILFPIGGLFNSKTLPNSEIAFENIVNMGTTKVYHGRAIHSQVVDSYSTALEMCPLTSDNKGFVALVDARPTNGICDITCLICNRLNISHLILGWEPPATLEQDIFTFSYHPPPELISKAYATLIKKLQWDKFTILYEDDGSFIRLQEVINSWPYNQDQILFRKLDPLGDNRETFKYIFKVVHMSYHVLDCDVKNIHKYMEEIVKVENSTQYQSFILTALDAYTVDLKAIPELMANVSTMHLTKLNDEGWKDLDMNVEDNSVRLETALAVDALYHLERAIRSLGIDTIDDSRRSQLVIDDPPSMCFRDSKMDYEAMAWPLGTKLRDALIMTSSAGFTGNISFDKYGKRKDFVLYYSKLSTDSRFNYVGYWDSRTDMLVAQNDVTERSSARSAKSVIRIVSRNERPYFEMDETNSTATPRGYVVELMKKIFEHIQTKSKNREEFLYEFYRVKGDSYGNPIAGTRKWDGVIGELLEHNAELAICDLTITSERNAVVEFSTPFMSLGISLLTKEPEPIATNMFSFIKPLSLDVWLYLATTYIIVSFVLLICARMSQEDWVNPHPCNQNPENLQNIWSLYNCMWLTMGSIMTQGCDILPRAAGSRWVAGMWWFFALIVTASYTANMSTFLSANRRSNEITDINDLTGKNSISYGTLYNGSTYKFFETSNDTLYKKLWSVMKSTKPTVFTRSNDEGRDRVQRSKSKYAFFMESTSIEYYMQKYCDLKMIGKLDSKDYGIAMPKNSPYKSLIDSAILALQESGELSELKKKWWEQEVNSKNCKTTENEKDDDSLQMKNTSGIFLVLGMGGIIGFFVAIIDFLLHAKKICVKEKVTFKEALASEWRASLNPRALHKPAAPPRSAAPSTATPSPQRERSQSRAVSVLRAASSFINFDEIY